MSFKQWMGAVDRIVGDRTGVSIFDLEDFGRRDLYDEGDTPEEAAEEAMRELVYMNESDPDFYDYMAISDADPGL